MQNDKIWTGTVAHYVEWIFSNWVIPRDYLYHDMDIGADIHDQQNGVTKSNLN